MNTYNLYMQQRDATVNAFLEDVLQVVDILDDTLTHYVDTYIIRTDKKTLDAVYNHLGTTEIWDMKFVEDVK